MLSPPAPVSVITSVLFVPNIPYLLPKIYSSESILNEVNDVSKYSPLWVSMALSSLFLSISPSRVEITYPPFSLFTITLIYWFEISSVLLSVCSAKMS